MRDGVALAQVVIERSQRRQLAPDGGTGQALLLQMGAPGQDMTSGPRPEFLRLHDAGERHEGFQVVFIRAPGLRAIQVGKPLGLGRQPGPAAESARPLAARRRVLEEQDFQPRQYFPER